MDEKREMVMDSEREEDM